ncbi:MAG TPA: hypothetical protein VKK31_13960 [Thermoanaerobaculia bacterium]|nr:hypothetical protein [Thermoanaerobaculia bacterium]
MKVKVWVGLLGASLALGVLAALFSPWQMEPAGKTAKTGQANPSALQSAYLDWAADHTVRGGDRNVFVGLGWSKGLSREYSGAHGLAKLDFVGGSAQVELEGLTPGEQWDVWLVENAAGGSALPESKDRMHRLGRLTGEPRTARLAARLEPGFFQHFQVDMVVVSRAGKRPEQAGVLFGSPELFQRLYTKGRTNPSFAAGRRPVLASLFGPQPAFATPFDSLDPLVAQGADLFFNEQFSGNGRTCGTCHPSQNNFTIDPKFIATLAPDNPLFVAETNPALAQNFEKPQLMRALGLVLENVDGFENLQTKFVLRGVPHTLAMLNSRVRQPGSPNPPAERLGWDGGGSPGAGTIRDFALGAINQHFTKTLTRSAGVDFRAPTDQELDALAAFQLALGRQADPNLAAMQFTSPVVNRGKAIYMAQDSVGGTVAAGKCQACHGNGGSNGQEGDNRNFDIGTENLADHPADLIAPGMRPRDGGFGKTPFVNGAFGNGRFNVPVVIESADTGPFFHNNSVDSIEEAVAFYNSKAFNNSPLGVQFKAQDTGGIGIQLEATQVEAVASLLRVLNALENIRSSSELDQAVLDKDFQPARTLADLASFDTEDAFQVLEERGLHLVAVRKLKEAFVLEKLITFTHSGNKRAQLVDKILELKAEARAEIIVTP